MTIRRVAILVTLAVLSFAPAAHAQYFGRNKVQYQKFDFKVLKTEHFDLYYYPQEEAAVQLAARMAERWYARLSRVLQHELSGRQPIVLYASHPHFEQTNTLEGELGEGTGGVTEALKRRVILPFAGALGETDHVLGHELVHAFQYDMATRRDPEGNLVGPGVMNLPLWFIEGMAEYLSLGPVDANTAMWVRDAASRDRMPKVKDLNNPSFFPYRFGQAFWAYVAGRWGDQAVGDMLRATGTQGDIKAAMQTVLGIDEDTFNTDWHEATRRTYAPFFETTRKADAFGRPLITHGGTGGDLNVAPALSPDGKRLVFLSERSMFSIDMYLADAANGHIIRKIVATSTDPHFDSLQFITSAGDWAPDNRRFVFAALSKGKPVLSLIDVDRDSTLHEQTFDDLDEIYNPAWSPDGRQIAFSALHGGFLDLYLYDVDTSAVKALTQDPYADLDPEWSPDGRSLAWVTDRFSSDTATLDFGNYRIGQLDVRTGAVKPLAGFSQGRNTNPEFSADGRTLYFVATPDGIPNIYRMPVGDTARTATRITNVTSGVSGITPLTPALSVAAAAPQIVFTVFENNDYNLYETNTGTANAAAPAADRDAAVLPPYNRRTGEVQTALAAPTQGLPAATEYPKENYKPKLSLDAVGQPTVGVGADRFGAYAAGGLSLLWSDMLGNHIVGTTIQATSRFQEIGAAVEYLNRRARWNWGIIGEQTPYVTGSFASGIGNVPGTGTAIVEETRRITQIDRGLSAVVQYPFNRAQRVEFTGGIRRVSFDNEIDTEVFSLTTGSRLDRRVQDLPRPDSLNLGETGAALVYDSSLMGATGPIIGQRYRFEITQTAGSLMYSGLLADFRRYFMPARPFTIALRGLHYGRYGRDGEDTRLAPMYLGYPGLIRGYDISSFDASECVSGGSCNAFDQLVGSRLALVGAELRAPLFGLFSRRSLYGPLPLEVALFTDAGSAWTSGHNPEFLGGDHQWVRSAGAALRANAFGYAILELDYVRPFDRPGRGWIWEFNLTPGF